MLEALKVIFALVLLSMLAVTTVRADEATEPDGGDKGTGQRLRLGGRLYLDGARTSPGSGLETRLGPAASETEVRRARLNLQLHVNRRLRFKVAWDLVAERWKSYYVELREIADTSVRLRLGRTKEPFGLEKVTSSKYLTFMERSLANAFEPGFGDGLRVSGTARKEHLTWSLGVFRNDDSFGEAPSEDRYNFTGRVTATPLSDRGDRRLLHLGAGFSVRNPERRALRLRQRPEAHLAPRLVDTGVFDAVRVRQVGVEAAVVLGPFSAQAELIGAALDLPDARSPARAGTGYAEISCFLTGEHRLYRRSRGAFGGPLSPRGRWGAVQLGLRYSAIDLDDAALAGGRQNDWTLAVNWHWNRYSRLMLNYVEARLTDGGILGVFQARLQANF